MATIRRLGALPAATAGALALLAVGLGWRGGDWPAQLLRVHLVDRDGLAVWNNMWFDGHHTPGYGVVFPLLAAAVGPAAVAVAACVVAATCFHLLVTGDGRDRHPSRVMAASLLFAAGTVVNVAVGRLTFAAGMAVGMAALAALQRRHDVLGTALAVATAPASPVAGAVLALVLVAWAVHTRRLRLLAVAAVAAAPIAVAAVLFPQGGRFPFRAEALLWSLVVAGLVAAVTAERVVRLAALAYAAACVLTFVVPNPLGANATRFGMFVAAPVVLVTARRLRAPLVAIAVPAIVWWQWSPAVDGIARAGRDPSSAAAYHAPLVAAVRAQPGAIGRVEVVPTQRHWETDYVAAELPLARGWERQLDIGRNPDFYDGRLDAASYHRWLRDQAVRFVALADVPLDPSGQREAQLVRQGLPFLVPVWHDDHWQLWRVRDARPLVEGPARLVELGPTTVTLDVGAAGPVLVRVRYTTHWSLDGPGCVAPDPAGWTIVRAARPGPVTLRPVLARSLLLFGSLDGCA